MIPSAAPSTSNYARDTIKDREIVRIRKDSASGANERSDSGCQRDAGCCRFRFHGKPHSATFRHP